MSTMTTATETVTVYGWELHFEGGTSDKFYRMLFFQSGENRWTALANYGKRDAQGQFKAYNGTTQNAALRLAQDKTNEKESGHYRQTRNLTTFEIDREVAYATVYSDTVDTAEARKIVSSFIKAAREQGHELPGASR